MAQATSREDCIQRHVKYPFDVWKKMDSLQRKRMEMIGSMIPNCSKVLDIGCNSGYISYFVPPGCICYGVDVAEGLVAEASKRIKAQLAAADELPFDDNFFDVSILGEILEHVFDAEAVLNEAVRVTKTKLVGSVPHERGEWGPRGMHPVDRHDFHVRQFTEMSLRELLEPKGKLEVATIVHKKKPQMYVFSLYLA